MGKKGGKPILVQSKIKFPVEKKSQLQLPSDGQTNPTEKKVTEKNLESKEDPEDGKVTVASKLKLYSKVSIEDPKLDGREETTTVKSKEYIDEKNSQEVQKEKKIVVLKPMT